MSTVFVRYEKKYVISGKQQEELVSAFFSNGFEYDLFSEFGKLYPVYSIYYDTLDLNVVRQSLMLKSYREKLRIRFYKYPLNNDDKVFLELKKKLQGKGNKRRLLLNYNDAVNFINLKEKPKFEDFLDIQNFKEIDFYIQNHKLVPFSFIKYERLALVNNINKMRVTFDFNVEFKKINSVLDINDSNLEQYAKDTIILEIKSMQNYPLWLSKKLTELNIYSQGFSKHKNTYRTIIEGEKIYVNT